MKMGLLTSYWKKIESKVLLKIWLESESQHAKLCQPSNGSLRNVWPVNLQKTFTFWLFRCTLLVREKFSS